MKPLLITGLYHSHQVARARVLSWPRAAEALLCIIEPVAAEAAS